MKEWFGDTSWFIAMIGADEVHHAQAVALSSRREAPLVITDWIITELADGMSRPPSLRRVFARILSSIQSDPTTVVVPAENALFRRGLALHASRPDKEWSLTDCISFIVMKDRGITEALTGDHHFEQAGFVALMK